MIPSWSFAHILILQGGHYRATSSLMHLSSFARPALSTLPDSVTWEDCGVCFCHGSPWAPKDGYVYPDTPLDQFKDVAASIFCLGNTHYPMHRRVGEKIIINPGSLGQPRHGGWPSYAVFDLPSGNVVFREVRYNKALLYCQMEEAMETNLYLKEVLCRSK